MLILEFAWETSDKTMVRKVLVSYRRADFMITALDVTYIYC